ncbi:pyridoxine/pyridoxamine 5'-phosphate oxidase [Allostreptomyces psammosilenae]|uniref:Pyridoxamine 5'-phosphate oxidase n=1 Tax=Allostreptomyces psammosilenae TaxID=1892865 RepID=A0A852ZSX9_9ACTN|nr:pyridoxal 5'-phosphate synthase [Allostreptomyces psammosilenae]NYI04935.1 pyridoxamine 5'-phosphate oxidase [Allostreptomyces psammosilenae]
MGRTTTGAEPDVAPSSVTESLRGLATLAGPLPEFDVDRAPDAPGPLFGEWFVRAVREEVREPHAMVLSTVDAHGRPDARVLTLREVDPDAGTWTFGTSIASPKGRQLDAVPWAALTFYWPEQGRQIRVRGPVVRAKAARNAQDFLRRGPAGRVMSLVGRQSEPMPDPTEWEEDRRRAELQLERHPGVVAADWALYTLTADRVEFWQGDDRQRHRRLEYRRDRAGARWTRVPLRP